ncbi:AraC family transcriptional regulator [Lapidilactobacillus luobeiensis]|uniref:AraC family transcriptional regulator n=1 Tax=Lapidilactobacillus luobeiensis TaxID=2950371 RepID=UPI0021C48AE3|nr:AraC family transcriptional regulator [Lapidilactobacillus luobeiensis]
MNIDYRQINLEHFTCNIDFYGQEQTLPNYAYSGNNIRQDFVLHYVLSGSGQFASAGQRTVKLQAGDIFLLPQKIPCFYQAAPEDPWHYFWIGFSGVNVAEIFSQSGLADRYYLRQTQTTNFQKSLNALFATLHQPQSLKNRLAAESLMFQTFSDLLTDFPSKQAALKTTAWLKFGAARDYIDQNLAQGYNITDVCNALHLSRSYLYTLFQQYLTLSPQQYLVQARTNAAKNLLLTSDYSLALIAEAVGYKDQFVFSRAFKRATGLSPQKFRQQRQT